LAEVIEIRHTGLHWIERSPQYADYEIRAPVAVQVTGGRRIVSARLERRLRRERDPIAVEVRTRTGALIPDPQETRLEKVAPQYAGTAATIDIEDGPRVGAVQAGRAPADYLDILEPPPGQAETSCPFRT